jgi:DNA-binding Lrp family transcriptional regulator
MKQDFLAQFIGSQNQARILRTLVFNEEERFTAKYIAKRTGMSEVSAARELESLKKLGVVRSMKVHSTETKAHGKAELTWFLNAGFQHLKALVGFVREVSPMHYDEIIDTLKRSGKLSAVVLSGSFMGDASRPADILVAGDTINEDRLETAVKELEPLFGRELRYAAFSTPEFRYRLTISDRLIRDTLDYPHVVLLDRSGLLI